MKKHLLTLCLTLLIGLQAIAQDQKPIYNASKFGIRSDGVTMNTRSIQFAIDWIAEQGGGGQKTLCVAGGRNADGLQKAMEMLRERI